MEKLITAIIPTFSNSAGLTTVVNYLQSQQILAIIVDNAPSPTKRRLGKQSGVVYLPQTKNLGFARAINIAAEQVKTPWMIILNDDIEFSRSEVFTHLIATATKEKYAAISPRLVKKSGELENLGYRVLPMGRVELIFDRASQLDGLTAACLVMRTEVFHKLGGFDERFISYLEDVDLFLRLKKAGYRFGIDYKTTVTHAHMTTSRKMGNFKAKMDLRNWYLLIAKHWTLSLFISHAPGILVERLRNLSGYRKATWHAKNKKTT